MKEKLKPCPFCGSENIEIVRSPITERFIATCNSCAVSSRYFNDEDEAIEGWNRRAEESKQYDEGYIDGYVKAKLEISKRLEDLRDAYLVQYLDILKEKNQ